MNSGTEVNTANDTATKGISKAAINIHHRQRLRTLLSMRRFSAGLDEHRNYLKQIENELNELNKNSLALLQAYSPDEARKRWQATLEEINGAILSVNQLLNLANNKVERKDHSDSSELWLQIEAQIGTLELSCKKMEDLGFELLAESEQKHWKTNALNFQESILPLFVSHAMAYKVELQMIEKYTPEELSKVTQTILHNIPDNFTFEEAEKYEREYLKAMDDLEKEFHEEKNLWDTFLDILAGGTHQTPAERVMLNRWMEGEKGELSSPNTQ